MERSILSPGVRINSFSRVADSVLLDHVEVGREARVTRAIVDKHVKIPPGLVIGEDPEADRRRFDVTPGGVVVIPKNAVLG